MSQCNRLQKPRLPEKVVKGGAAVGVAGGADRPDQGEEHERIDVDRRGRPDLQHGA